MPFFGNAVCMNFANSITTENELAENERLLFALAVEHDLWHGADAPASVLASIKDIADQCPKDGGYAVYDARTIYISYFHDARWDDLTNCDEGIEERTIAPAEEEWTMQIAPNPSDKQVFISFDRALPSAMTLQISDASGKVVYVGQVEKGQQSLSIQTNEFQAGIYFVDVQGAIAFPQHRFVVIH